MSPALGRAARPERVPVSSAGGHGPACGPHVVGRGLGRCWVVPARLGGLRRLPLAGTGGSALTPAWGTPPPGAGGTSVLRSLGKQVKLPARQVAPGLSKARATRRGSVPATASRAGDALPGSQRHRGEQSGHPPPAPRPPLPRLCRLRARCPHPHSEPWAAGEPGQGACRSRPPGPSGGHGESARGHPSPASHRPPGRTLPGEPNCPSSCPSARPPTPGSRAWTCPDSSLGLRGATLGTPAKGRGPAWVWGGTTGRHRALSGPPAPAQGPEDTACPGPRCEQARGGRVPRPRPDLLRELPRPWRLTPSDQTPTGLAVEQAWAEAAAVSPRSLGEGPGPPSRRWGPRGQL